MRRVAGAAVIAALVVASSGFTGRRDRAVPDPLVRTRVTLGRSVEGRPITAVELGDPNAPRRVLVVGIIHGNETAGRRITQILERGRTPAATDLWAVDSLNPDGVARGTRQNAHRVDLNRNFAYRWRPLGRPGDQQYSGPGPLSEPESRIAHALISRLRPDVTIWFHQPLGLTDLSGGDSRIERRFARLSGLPARRLQRYPGSATTWQNHRFRSATAFVVELPPGPPAPSDVARYVRAVRFAGSVE
ncbi:MAG: M14 family zinc carboxypeptidase [Thermoleophilaceae bacterium]